MIEGTDRRHELYDLSADPHEGSDQAAAQVGLRDRLSAALARLLGSLRGAVPARPSKKPSPEHLQRLKSVGYVGSESEEPVDDKP